MIMEKQDKIFSRPPWWEVHSFRAGKEGKADTQQQLITAPEGETTIITTMTYGLVIFDRYVTAGKVKLVQPGKHCTKAQAAMPFTSENMTNSRCGTPVS
ncbi:hypothetical protein Tco_0905103 [Tanacetum coccineum]